MPWAHFALGGTSHQASQHKPAITNSARSLWSICMWKGSIASARVYPTKLHLALLTCRSITMVNWSGCPVLAISCAVRTCNYGSTWPLDIRPVGHDSAAGCPALYCLKALNIWKIFRLSVGTLLPALNYSGQGVGPIAGCQPLHAIALVSSCLTSQM